MVDNIEFPLTLIRPTTTTITVSPRGYFFQICFCPDAQSFLSECNKKNFPGKYNVSLSNLWQTWIWKLPPRPPVWLCSKIVSCVGLKYLNRSPQVFNDSLQAQTCAALKEILLHKQDFVISTHEEVGDAAHEADYLWRWLRIWQRGSTFLECPLVIGQTMKWLSNPIYTCLHADGDPGSKTFSHTWFNYVHTHTSHQPVHKWRVIEHSG